MKSWGDKIKISEAPINKLARLIIAGAFLFNTTVTDLAWAREVSPVLSPVGAAADSGLGHPSVGDIKVPEQYGRLKESFSGDSGKLIIQIQDIHSNYEGQKNLANILISLIEDHKLKVIMMEGGITDRDFSYLRMWHSVEERKKKAAKLLKDGVITGEAYVNIATDYPLKFQGAEDRELYEKNMAAYLKTELFAEEGLQLVTRLRNISDNLKRNMYNRALKQFDKKLVAYHNEQIGFTEYLELLKKTSDKNKIDLKAYTDFEAILNLMSLEAKINFAKVERERDNLISQITNSGRNKVAIEQLYNKGTEFKEGKISQNEFYNYLISLAQDFEVDLAKYVNLSAYVDYITAYRKIDISSLFEDINELEGVIISGLSKNAGERELSKISRHLGVLEKFLKLKLIPQDFAYFKANKNDFFAKDWLSFLKLHSSKFKLSTFVPDDVSIIDNNIPILGSFYEAAIARDYAFVRNTLSKMSSENENFSCLIAGGFHTQHLTQLFREEGISYVVIAPKAKATTDEGVYKKELKDSYNNRIWDEINPVLASRSQMRRTSPMEDRSSILRANETFGVGDLTLKNLLDNNELLEVLRGASSTIPEDVIQRWATVENVPVDRILKVLDQAGLKVTRVTSIERLGRASTLLHQLVLAGPPSGPGGASKNMGDFLRDMVRGGGVYYFEPTADFPDAPFHGFVRIDEDPKRTDSEALEVTVFVGPTESTVPTLPLALTRYASLTDPDGLGSGETEQVLSDVLLGRGKVTIEAREFFSGIEPKPIRVASVRGPETGTAQGPETGIGQGSETGTGRITLAGLPSTDEPELDAGVRGDVGEPGAKGPSAPKGQADQQASIIPRIPGITTTPEIPGITTTPAVNPLWYIAGLTPAQIKSLLGQATQATVDLAGKVADEVRAAETRTSPTSDDRLLRNNPEALRRLSFAVATMIKQARPDISQDNAAAQLNRAWSDAHKIIAQQDNNVFSGFSPELITQEAITIALMTIRLQSTDFNPVDTGFEPLETAYRDGLLDVSAPAVPATRDTELGTALASYVMYPVGDRAKVMLRQIVGLKNELKRSALTPNYSDRDLAELEPALFNMLVAAKRAPKARESLTSRFTPEGARRALNEQIRPRTPIAITAFSFEEAESMMLIAAALSGGDLGEAGSLVEEVNKAQNVFANSGIRMDPGVILHALAARGEGERTVQSYQYNHLARTLTWLKARDKWLEQLSLRLDRKAGTVSARAENKHDRIFLFAVLVSDAILDSGADAGASYFFDSLQSAMKATDKLVRDLRRAGISPEVLGEDAATLALLGTQATGGERQELERGAGIISDRFSDHATGGLVTDKLPAPQPTTTLAAVTIFGDGPEAETIVREVLKVRKEIVESGFAEVPEDADGRARQEAVILNRLLIAKSKQPGPLSAKLSPDKAKGALEKSLHDRVSGAFTELSDKEVDLIMKATLVQTGELEQAVDMATEVDEVLRRLSRGLGLTSRPAVVFRTLASMPEGERTADELSIQATEIADKLLTPPRASPLSVTDEQAFAGVVALGSEANAETLSTMLEVAPKLAEEAGVTEEAAFASALRHPEHFDRFSSGVDRGPMIAKTVSEGDSWGRKDLTKLSRGPVVTTVVVDHVTPENEVYVVVESGQVAPLTDGQTAKISEIGITEIRITSGVERINMFLQDAIRISENPGLKALQELLAPRRAVGHSNLSLNEWPKETTKQAIALAGDLFNETILRNELYIILHRLKLERNRTPIRIAMVGDISELAIAELQKIAAEFDTVELIGRDGLTADMIKAGYEDEANLMGYTDPESEIYIAVPRPKIVNGQVMELVSASNIFLAAFSYGAQKANLISVAELEILLERITKFLVIQKGPHIIKTITDTREMERKALIAI